MDDEGEEVFDDGTIWESYGDTTEFYEGRSVCAKCPIQEACLAGAMERRERFGLWGGKTPIERRRIERSERREKLRARRRAEALGQALPPDDDEDPEPDDDDLE